MAPRTAARADRSKPYRAFAQACWDFADAPSSRELHPYPARFIPAIPGQALDLLDVDGPVLDPFCGSGTTLAEARRRGLPSTGVDLNPIACLISRTRTHPWRATDAKLTLEHSSELREHAARGSDPAALAERIPRVDHWFDPWAQEALGGALGYLQTVDDLLWRDRVATAISSVLVRISRQESDTRYAAIDKPGDRERAATQLAQAVVRVGEWLAANNGDGPAVESRVVCGDARDIGSLDGEPFAAAIFSPPYPNAYEYWLYHKYRMYWLGFDPTAVRESELGARPHYCKPNGLTEIDFARQMGEVFSGLRESVQPGGPVVVVVGDSTIGGRHVDNGQLLIETAAEAGLEPRAHAERTISVRRSSFNRAHSRGRRTEHVLLFTTP